MLWERLNMGRTFMGDPLAIASATGCVAVPHARPRVAMVTNIPAPYRLRVFELLAAEPDIDLHLFFCSEREPDREWDLRPPQVPHTFMRPRLLSWRGRYIHTNLDIWRQLRGFRADVVVTTGFNPTHLLAYACARWTGARHIAMTDGTAQSEAVLTAVHRGLRRWVYRHSQAFVGASQGSRELYAQYGLPESSFFQSHLCADNPAYAAALGPERDADFIFCGRFVAGKLPLFAIEVAAATARRLGRRVRLLLVGSGELLAGMQVATGIVSDWVDAEFLGFARQADLPGHYARAKLLLFPTLGDTWGVVANEACAAGVVVLVSPQAGVAGDLVRDGHNGRVLPLRPELWAEVAADILADAQGWQQLSQCSQASVQDYTYLHAAQGLARAVRHTVGTADTAAALRRKRVVLLQRRMTHYRVPLFNRMRALLARRHIDLDVVYGDPSPAEASKRDSGRLAWGHHVPCHYALGERLCWQWAWPQTRGADLVIAPQENRLLLNYLLIALRFLTPMAFWGHGRNFQSKAPNGWRERFKRRLLLRAQWWFAYTELSAEVVRAAGYPAHNITVVNNAFDLGALESDLKSLAGADEAALRRSFGLGAGPVLLVLGSLYADKRLDFVLDVASRVQAARPDMQLLVVGDGPDRSRFEASARGKPWVHCTGALSGMDKARALHLATVMLNPYAAGLTVLDSFAAGVPMVVVDAPGHGPELGYLKHGVNGLISRAEPEACAADVLALLGDPARHAEMAAQAKLAAEELTLEHMAERFCDGIQHCLDHLGKGQRRASA
jgi:glycosyltransferase involved in cell wall biosynthesis